MKVEPLTLEHEAILKPRFQALELCLSEYSFASRYLFRREYDFKVVSDENSIWLLGKTSDGQSYLMPTENIQKFSQNELSDKLQWASCFYPIPEIWVPTFHPDKFQIKCNRNDSDYLFKREKIATYPGRKLSKKRNLLKQFRDNYEPKVVPYSKQHLSDALFILNEWQKSFKGKHNDFFPCQDGLELAERLGLIGYMYYIEDKPAAFILGEVLRPHLFDIHFAKGLVEYKGIYAFLFQELANLLGHEEISCLNWEQDLGEEGLRQSKLSYQPDKIAHKYRIFSSVAILQ